MQGSFRKNRDARYFNDEQLKSEEKTEPSHLVNAPHTFVVTQGKTDRIERILNADIRKVMEPFTAVNLKTKKKNTVRDFVAMGGFFNVKHMLILNKTVGGHLYLRITSLPRGPTLTFRVRSFSTATAVRRSLKKVVQMAQQYSNSPLLVQNNFSGEGMHFKLMSTMFQNMLPTINVNHVNLNNLKRCLLLNYDPTNDVVEWRHYSIKLVPTGLERATKKIFEKKVPNLGKLTEIADIIENNEGSESEADELIGRTNRVRCPEKIVSRGNVPGQQSALRLYELGPRLTLQLVRIEDGLCGGRILYGQNNVVPKLPQYKTKPDEIAPPPKPRKRPEKIKKNRTFEEKRKAKLQRRQQRKALEEKDKGATSKSTGPARKQGKSEVPRSKETR